MEVPAAPAIKKGKDWKTIGLVALGGAAALAGGAFILQSNDAALGRITRKQALAWLTTHGASASNGVISGGPLGAPMKENQAVVATLLALFGNSQSIDEDVVPAAAQQQSPVTPVSPQSSEKVQDVVPSFDDVSSAITITKKPVVEKKEVEKKADTQEVDLFAADENVTFDYEKQ